MPWFKALAGFSPICDAVLVQTEHCAFTLRVKSKVLKKINSITIFLIICYNKVTKQTPCLAYCLTKNCKKIGCQNINLLLLCHKYYKHA